jgi:hypothetical protein
MFAFIFSFLLACGEKETDTANSITVDTAQENVEETEETNNIGGMEEYVSAYCSSYGLRCGIYGTQESCESDVSAWYNSSCSIVDNDSLDTCLDWLSEFSCEDRGWIDECSQFYSCD